jgi:hypothetical protein
VFETPSSHRRPTPDERSAQLRRTSSAVGRLGCRLLLIALGLAVLIVLVILFYPR